MERSSGRSLLHQARCFGHSSPSMCRSHPVEKKQTLADYPSINWCFVSVRASCAFAGCAESETGARRRVTAMKGRVSQISIKAETKESKS